jgi:hypothetical protein
MEDTGSAYTESVLRDRLNRRTSRVVTALPSLEFIQRTINSNRPSAARYLTIKLVRAANYERYHTW